MTPLLGLSPDELERYFADLGEKPFRARQVSRWLHQRFVGDFAQMTDLAKSAREKLAAHATIAGPAVIRDTTAADGTRKWLLDAGGGNAVEAVYIPEGVRDAAQVDDDDAESATTVRTGPRYRGTLCISSQAGCALDCAFCSTGKQGFNRNLTTAEIVGQLWHANRTLLAESAMSAKGRPERELRPLGGIGGPSNMSAKGRPERELRPLGGIGGPANAPWIGQGRAPITNVVMMGMGEPLANFDQVTPALRLFLDDNAYGLSRRRVTLSTSGLVPQIDRLAQECPVALAVSLHAPNDALRDTLVPINRRYPLRDLVAACNRYLAHAPRDFVTFEYVMLDGINDQPEHARELSLIAREVPCKLNLIPFNPFPGSEFRTSPRHRIRAFQQALTDGGVTTTIRRTRGDDIDAACGQLAGQVRNRVIRRLSEKAMRVASR